jgi:hypothetical protein
LIHCKRDQPIFRLKAIGRYLAGQADLQYFLNKTYNPNDEDNITHVEGKKRKHGYISHYSDNVSKKIDKLLFQSRDMPIYAEGMTNILLAITE